MLPAMDDKYLETLNWVVEWLHQQGFHQAHSSLLVELVARPESDLLAPRPSASAPRATTDGLSGQHALEAESVAQRSRSAEPAPTWCGVGCKWR